MANPYSPVQEATEFKELARDTEKAYWLSLRHRGSQPTPEAISTINSLAVSLGKSLQDIRRDAELVDTVLRRVRMYQRAIEEAQSTAHALREAKASFEAASREWELANDKRAKAGYAFEQMKRIKAKAIDADRNLHALKKSHTNNVYIDYVSDYDPIRDVSPTF